MLREIFVDQIIKAPHSQLVEETASESHETRRVPDPYLFLVKNGKLVTPKEWVVVEEKIEKNSYLGVAEFGGFKKIQEWADASDEGTVLWFSPPYPGKYPVSKIIASEILYTPSGEKVLFNRAIVIDIGAMTLLLIANEMINGNIIQSPEILRATPIFLTPDQVDSFFQIISEYTNQTELIEMNEDISIKARTYTELSEIESGVLDTGYVYESDYTRIYKAAQKIGLIGEHQGSCSGASSGTTALEAFFKNSLTPEGFFSCPKCQRPIPSGLGITKCPHCGITKEEVGSACD